MKKLERPDAGKLKADRPKLERPERPPRGMQWPKLETLWNPIDDPLAAFDPTGDQEDNANQIMVRVEGAFIEDEGRKLDEYRTMVDPEFYVVVCFQSYEQKMDFLAKAGFADLGEKYIDGLKVAKRMGLDVPPIPLPTKEPKRMPRLLRDIQILAKGGE